MRRAVVLVALVAGTAAELARVPAARFVLIPVGPTTRGHGTHTAAAVWKHEVAPFIERLARARGL